MNLVSYRLLELLNNTLNTALASLQEYLYPILSYIVA